jgi:hypothetical protein
MTMVNSKDQTLAKTVDPNNPYPDVQARPLQMPDFVNLRPRNPNVAFRWINRSVGAAGSTQRLDEMIYAGFVPATAVDAVMPDGKPVMPNLIKDGKIIRGDLILCKIDRAQYEGALKYNWERSIARLHPARQLQTGRSQLSKAVSGHIPGNMQKTIAQKLQAFRPGSGETTADPSFLAEDDKLPTERKED